MSNKRLTLKEWKPLRYMYGYTIYARVEVLTMHACMQGMCSVSSSRASVLIYDAYPISLLVETRVLMLIMQ